MAEDVVEYKLIYQPEILNEDKMLVAKAKDDPEAIGKLFDKYYSEILGYIYHCTVNSDVAEDLTSNVFLAVFRHLDRFKWRKIPFRAWLYRIASNEVKMHWRRQKRIVTVDSNTTELLSRKLSGSESLTSEEEHRLLGKALSELKPKYRTVIILRYFEDKAIAEISEITGSKQGTIKSQLHRGLAKLQNILMNWGILPE